MRSQTRKPDPRHVDRALRAATEAFYPDHPRDAVSLNDLFCAAFLAAALAVLFFC